MTHTGDTSTSQMSQHALAVRFLTRTQAEVAQLRACLPKDALAVEPLAVAHLERMAQKIASSAEAFGFPEIGAIAGAIELLAADGPGRSMRERLGLVVRLKAQAAALDVHVQYELAEKLAQCGTDDGLPMSAHLPGFRSQRR